MPVTITVTDETADGVLTQMRQMFGARVFTDTSDLAVKRAAVLLADAEARQKGENLDGSPRRETVLVSDETPGPSAQLVGDNLTIKANDGTILAEGPKARTRRTKAEMDAARAAAATVEDPKQTDLEEAIAEATPAAEVPDLDDLRAALKRLGNADGHGHEAVISLLTEFGAKNASTVTEDKRRAVIDAIDAKLKGGE